jgi:hypothetical protein
MLEILCSSVVALLYGPNTTVSSPAEEKLNSVVCTAIIPIDYSLC